MPIDALERAQFAVLSTLPIATAVAVWPRASDPVAGPKVAVLLTLVVVLIVLRIVQIVATGRLSVPWGWRALAIPTLAGAFLVAALGSNTLWLALMGNFRRGIGLVTYGAVLLVFLVTLRVVETRGVRPLSLAVLGSALLPAIYGLVQAAGADPYQWRGGFVGDVVATFGNPNFASAFFGIMVPLAVWPALQRRLSLLIRLLSVSSAMILFALAVAARSIQGPIAAVIGMAVVVLAWLLEQEGRLRKAGVALWGAVVTLGGTALVFGLTLQAGPLAGIARAGSLENRLWFWEAAVNMIREHPFTGVGLGMYGVHYRHVRPVEATLASRDGVYADAPHSVPLAMFSEGGIVLGMAYLLFVALVAVALVRGLIRIEGDDRLLLGGLGGAWLAYQAQSAVSIDLLPLSLLHFMLAAAIVALAWPLPRRDLQLWGSPARRLSSARVHQGLVALGLVVVLAGAVQVTRPFRGDRLIGEALIALRSGQSDVAKDLADRSVAIAPWEGRNWAERGKVFGESGDAPTALASLSEAARRDPTNASYAFAAAKLAANMGSPEAGTWFERALRLEPTAPAVLRDVTQFHLAAGQAVLAVPYVERLVSIAHDDAGAWILLGEVRSVAGESDGAREAFRKALELDPGNENATEGLALLGSQG